MDLKYFSDRLKNLPTRNKPHIFFMHIPKTGGTSTIHALQNKYLFNFFKINAGSSSEAAKRKYNENYNSFDQCYDLRESVALYAMETGFKCIAGHIPYSENLFEYPGNKYLLMTLLRDPVQRFISKYMYNYHKSSKHCKFEMDFSEYLESDLAKKSGCEYLRYLSGYSLQSNKSIDDLILKSKENFNNFDLIGLLEDLDGFTSTLYAKTGIKLTIPHKNRTKDFTRDEMYGEDTINRIREICRYDIELYNFAKNNRKR